MMAIFREPHTIDPSPLRECAIIGIDGDQGAGKSTLALELCSMLGGSVIELDELLHQNGRPYVEQIHKERLRSQISSTAKPVIVEGVLLLDVLDLLDLQPDCLLFAKKELHGCWEYEQYLRPSVSLPKAKLTREIAEYYRRRRPFERAKCQFVLYVS